MKEKVYLVEGFHYDKSEGSLDYISFDGVYFDLDDAKKRTFELMKEADGTREIYGIKEIKFDKEMYERLGGYVE